MTAGQTWLQTLGSTLLKHSYTIVSSGIRELGICPDVQKKTNMEIRVARIALDVVIRRGLKPPLKHGPMVFIKRLSKKAENF